MTKPAIDGRVRADFRAKFFEAGELKRETVTSPAGDIEIRAPGFFDRARIVAAHREEDGTYRSAEMCAALLIECAYVPETGEKVFSIGDRDVLGAMDPAVIDPLVSVVMRLCQLDKDSTERAKNDSGATHSATPSTVSPENSEA